MSIIISRHDAWPKAGRNIDLGRTLRCMTRSIYDVEIYFHLADRFLSHTQGLRPRHWHRIILAGHWDREGGTTRVLRTPSEDNRLSEIQRFWFGRDRTRR